jgi:hypothetical protein
MKTLLVLCLMALPAAAALGPHVVERVRMKESARAVTYKDRLSDGTYRDSAVNKPVAPDYPGRVALVATNDLPAMWELVYAAYFESGKVSTNREYVVKQGRDRLKLAPEVPPLPAALTNAPDKADALALAKIRMQRAEGTVRGKVTTNKMGKALARVKAVRMEGGKAVQTLTDGSERAVELRTAHTARVGASYPGKREVPEPTGKSATFLLGFAAGVAAMGGTVLGAKKIKG